MESGQSIDAVTNKMAAQTLEHAPTSFYPPSLNEYCKHLTRASCSSCGNKIFGVGFHPIAIFDLWRTSGKIIATQKCPKCLTRQCPGCSEQHTKQSQNHIVVGNLSIDWCCDKGKLFVIWVLLCGFDEYNVEKKATNERRSQGRGKGFYDYDYESYPSRFSAYGSKWNLQKSKGVGYENDGFLSTFDDIQTSIQSLDARRDVLVRCVFQVLTRLLPGSENRRSFDKDPPSLLLQLLQGSSILDRAAELLRNDSLDDITKRTQLYYALLQFIEKLASHPAISAAVHSERLVKQEGVTLFIMTIGSGKLKGKDTTKSLADSLENLSTQSDVILQAGSKKAAHYNTPEAYAQISLCKEIVGLYSLLKPNAKKQAKAPRNWEEWQRQNCLLELDDNVVAANYGFTREARSLQGEELVRGRMQKLVEQIASLKTSLPPGIFVRYASSRPDCLKALIVGPVDTPYEGGLFEFDIICGSKFPVGPPKVKFMTTGGGRVHFNPNLYPDGKVCLSLLGTWEGQPWIPYQSTLLQVLVSIQSMILGTDNPLENEPGNLHVGTDTRPMNSSIRIATIYHAMCEWMNRSSTSIWRDAIQLHFQQNASHIMAVTQRWAMEARRGPQVRRIWVDDSLTYDEVDFPAAVARLNQTLSSFLQNRGATTVPKSVGRVSQSFMGTGRRLGEY